MLCPSIGGEGWILSAGALLQHSMLLTVKGRGGLGWNQVDEGFLQGLDLEGEKLVG